MSNFGHLCRYIDKEKRQKLHQIAFRGIRAEVYFVERDYNTCLMLCRQMVENLFKWLAQDNDIPLYRDDGTERALLDIINDVSRKIELSDYVIKNLHNIRKLGNKAIHDMDCNNVDEASAGLQNLHEVFASLFKFRYAPKNFVPQGFQEPTLAFIAPYIQQILDILNNPSPPPTKQPTASPISSKQKTKAKATASSSSQAGFNGKHLIRQAVEARKKGNHQESEQLLKEVLISNPDNSEALYHLALCYEKSSNPNKKTQVIALLEQATELGHFYAPTRLAQMLLEETPNTNEARQRIWEFLEKGAANGKDNQADMVYADIYEKGLLGNPIDIQQAIKHLQKAKDKGNTRAQEYIERLQHQLTQSANATHTKPQTQDDIDWQWWIGLTDDWKKLLVTKGLKIGHNTFNLLDRQQAMPYVQQILKLNELDLKHCHISHIQPLQSLTQLKWLNLSNNHINDIYPLTELRNLHTLYLNNNLIKNIEPLSELTNLQYLWIGYNVISDIAPLAHLSNLEWLTLHSNTISDISPLTALTQLTRLDLDNNHISDITPLAKLTQLEWLDLYNNELKNISPLQNLVSLQRIDLRNNKINNICHLANLTALKQLHLGFNTISDITPLAHMTELLELDLRENQISDISPLMTLTKLTKTSTHLSGNPINSLTQYSSYQTQNKEHEKLAPQTQDDIDWQWWINLTYDWQKLLVTKGLKIEFGPFRLLDGQQTMPCVQEILHLTKLNLIGHSIDNIAPLAKLTQLKHLYLQQNNISDITPLAKLTQLEYLSLHNNHISDITPLAKLTQLEWLNLQNNNISDITPLAKLTRLISINLRNNTIRDIKPLISLTQLQWLDLNDNNISELQLMKDLMQRIENRRNQKDTKNTQQPTTLQALKMFFGFY